MALPVPSGPTPCTPHTLEHQDHLAEVNSCSETTAKGKKASLDRAKRRTSHHRGSVSGSFLRVHRLTLPAQGDRKVGTGAEEREVGLEVMGVGDGREGGQAQERFRDPNSGEEKRGGGGGAGRGLQGRGGEERKTDKVRLRTGGSQRLGGWLTTSALSEARIARFKKSQFIISHPDWVWPLLAPWSLQGTPTSTLQESPI